MSRLQVPARRSDIRRGKAGDTVVLIDPVVGVTYAIDESIHLVWRALSKSCALQDLIAGIPEPPDQIRRALMFLAVRGLLAGKRAEHNLNVSRETPPKIDINERTEVPIAFTPGMRHECQACGSCCSATM